MKEEILEYIMREVDSLLIKQQEFGISEYDEGELCAFEKVSEFISSLTKTIPYCKIITLCGSTKFKKLFEQINRHLTLSGYIVLSVGVFGHADKERLSEENKKFLDELHFQKIAMSDCIFVINKDGYIGESTTKEIEYAAKHGKKILYYQ